MVRILNFKTIFATLLFSFAFISPVKADFSNNFASCIAKNETGGVDLTKAAANPGKTGYTGIYQMGIAYVGGYLCSNQASIPKMTSTTPQDWSKCDFKGTLSKSMGITSYAAFTTGPNAVAAQQYIFQKNSQSTWNEIVNKGYASYLGKTVNGVVMTQDTMVAMAHMSGVGGLGLTLNGKSVSDKITGATPTGYASCIAACLSGSTAGCNMKTGTSGASVYVNVCTGKANAPTE